MRSRLSPAEVLVSLAAQSDVAERRASFRQVVAALGQQSDLFSVSELDRVDVGQLVRACRAALQSGLLDDLDWIAPGAATLALYEITTALPPGEERREFGRRVFKRIYGGSGVAFAPVAARMAWSSVRQLESPAMRARVGLCLSLPIGSQVNADPLALALVAQRERFERWVAKGSLGPLQSRVLAANILDRASREAVRRAQLGDTHWVEWLSSDLVKPTLERLLADREPLVWRHAATARGMLSACDPTLREEIDLLLDPALGPTEWRRAAVSLVACVTHDQETALSQCRSLLRSDLVKAHPSLAMMLFWGLPPVIENDPEAAEELLFDLVQTDHPEVAPTLSALLDEVPNPEFGLDVISTLRVKLASKGELDSVWLTRLLARKQGEVPLATTVRAVLAKALHAFEHEGALPARQRALEALARAHEVMAEVERAGTGDAPNQGLQGLLLDLDTSVLHTGRLNDLLLLGMKPTAEQQAVPELENFYDRFGTWLVRQETEVASTTTQAAKIRQQRLVALLHLLDVQTSAAQDDEAAPRMRKRLKNATRVLLGNLRRAGPSAHRVMCAAVARSFDASVREGVADPSDLVLTTICTLHDSTSVRAIMDGSTNSDMRDGLAAYATFVDALVQNSKNESEVDTVTAFAEMARDLSLHGSHRGETLRQSLLLLGRAVEAVGTARSLSELVEASSGQRAVLEELADHAHGFEQLCESAVQRVLERSLSKGQVAAQAPRLSEVVERHLSSTDPLDLAELELAVRGVVERLPAPVRVTIAQVLELLKSLPRLLPSEVTHVPAKGRALALPDWLLPRRTIGSFYVLRALGAGGVSSVFVAKRIEERKDDDAELYALKVPHYDPTTARSLSEQEFLEMFRDEAGALLSLPRHPNIARFVNFDMAAKPKPILVMELIAGQSLEKVSRSTSLTMALVLKYLDGILAGLSAMHAAGVAHLDVKPSNVILRDENTAVLVDFGLSGRQLRPGCGTLEYCAPEILGVFPEDHVPQAIPADIYAFACTAYEMLTGRLLFDGTDEATIMTKHVSHDGWPEPLVDLSRLPGFRDFSVVLAAGLRRDPRARPTAAATRAALRAAAQKEHLAGTAWPVRPESYAQNKSA
jgi:eukaryotic-like serine/threonine-protein kinase